MLYLTAIRGSKKANLNKLGFPALWIPGLDGQGALDDVEHLLAVAPRATVALGVLSMRTTGRRPRPATGGPR
ncbi:hypothetical protein [Micromonospora sp. U21]|uniref:hypothetical protein n=1 Tax=Micromonospora sp. U21 TaxID=2824899 RepID=UPI001B373B9F|nr:hypothetical protein [Micromonospora sp. U21]MBQ0906927.1 hypothetical protein [Micromonospora sp. U21]